MLFIKVKNVNCIILDVREMIDIIIFGRITSLLIV